MKKLPIGYQNFKQIIEESFVYVDKTKAIYTLLDKGSLYFLSRPRRFGKSLLLSTLHQLFNGNKELFKGLYIYEKTSYDFASYPVLHFNFADYGHQVKNLEQALHNQLDIYAKEFKIKISYENLSEKFTYLIQQIAQQGKRVVILIDEYDKPIIDFLTDIEQAKQHQVILRRFFAPLKGMEAKGHLRFLFLTGVSKFSRVSLFSDLNNLIDLTISINAHDLVGITQTELEHNFSAHIQNAALRLEMTKEKVLEGVKLWYNGYSFEGSTRLYNPFSLLNFFDQATFNNFWFSTGTPTFLVNTIRDQYIAPQELESVEVTLAFFERFSLEHLDIKVLLHQTGYLTIRKVHRDGFTKSYELSYPNEEVRRSFVHSLLEAFTWQPVSTIGSALIKMERGLQQGEVSTFITQLKVLFSDIAYHLLPKKRNRFNENNEVENFKAWEGYFHTVIYLITSFLGLQVQSEIAKHKGRLDLIAQTKNFLYLMEFKLDEPAKNAIEQIKNREYAAAYEQSDKTVILVGINFSKVVRNVESWESEVWLS